jgi:hypothetical protein
MSDATLHLLKKLFRLIQNLARVAEEQPVTNGELIPDARRWL